MLIGLYLLTPIVKPFLVGSSKETTATALLVIGIICSVLPTIEFYGINMAKYGLPWVTIVLFVVVIFALSWALTYMLRLIPVFRKYVL